MWTYEKKLQYPVNIKTPNPRLAKFIISQLGGPDGTCCFAAVYAPAIWYEKQSGQGDSD